MTGFILGLIVFHKTVSCPWNATQRPRPPAPLPRGSGRQKTDPEVRGGGVEVGGECSGPHPDQHSLVTSPAELCLYLARWSRDSLVL